MECPTCGAVLVPATECAWCAARERAASPALAGGVVDALPRPGEPGSAPLARAGMRWPAPTTSRALPVAAPLPARLWRQPAVRAVARAGAGAFAFSIGLRLARALLARATTRRAVPTLARALAELPPTTRLSLPAARGAEVVETWIYVRQRHVGR